MLIWNKFTEATFETLKDLKLIDLKFNPKQYLCLKKIFKLHLALVEFSIHLTVAMEIEQASQGYTILFLK